ncbi:PREDICTED: probable E3 ubiquitin-protein ligase XERICO [Populus euphratica]|uniref:Probable E3 ubiquitin-protein ligase XERICO n=1 Tax=Populus euphratica TaxID=75702 RepID=A0AAJ6XWQ2_POPEU|nr:PREDICTED: probable E3 ubiquitin-protein ligase XERICO [Populus euphratica]
MGLSSFPGAAGVLPELLMNAILLVALLKNTVTSGLRVMVGANWTPPDYEGEPDGNPQENARERRMSITQFKSLQQNDGTCYGVSTAMECCVCLCGFQAEEEVSELHCKHFFHRACLDKWFDNKQATCPLCRSIILFDS